MNHYSRIRPTASLLLLLIAGFLLQQVPLFAQQTSGSVTGTVADATGAIIPKAAVILTNEGNGTTRTTASGSAGKFSFAAVLPGNYHLEVIAPTFRSWQSQTFTMLPGDERGFANINLQVGSQAESVTVEAQPESQVPLDSGERSDVIDAKEMDTMAVVGRDATELVRTLPGFQMSSGNQGLNNRPGYNTAVVGLSGPTGSFSANGSGTNGIAVVSDGVSLTDIGSNSGTVQSVDIDGVSEIKATTSTFSAESAQGPAVINAVGKSGGSTFHGSVYFYGRDTVMNSNDWYDNELRQSRPDGRYLYPGATFGGPLVLPFTDFNRARNKVFFFVQYEYRNQSFEANQQALTAWVPTAGERKGDYSAQTLDAQLCGSRPDGAANPNAILAMCHTLNYLPFGEYGTIVPNSQVTTSLMDSVFMGPDLAGGKAMVNWMPAPNADPFTNTFGYNYIQQLTQHQNGQQFHGKIDYSINENNKMFVTYGLQREIDEQPVSMNSFPQASMPYPGKVTTGDVSSTMSASYTRIMGPSLTNELTAAMSFVSLPGKMGDPNAASRYHMDSYNGGNGDFNYQGMYKNNGDLSVPAIGQSSGGDNGYANLLMPGGFYANHVRMKKVVPTVSDALSWMKGSHFFKFGAYWGMGTLNGLADYDAYPQGKYTFNSGNSYFEDKSTVEESTQYIGCTSPNTAGTQRLSGASFLGSCMNPVALMYMGYADTYTQANFSPLVDMKFQTISGFAQDTWKLRRLTLNLGVRVEHLGPWSDKHDNGLAVFSSSLYKSQCTDTTSRTCTSDNMPGISWHGTDKSLSNSGNKPPKVYAEPRVGVAYDLFGNSNTVLRGGWGIYRSQEEFNPYAMAAATAQGYKISSLQGTLTFDQIDSTTPQNPMDYSVDTIDQNDTKRPIHYQYNGTISQRAPWGSRVEISFVGSRNQNLSTYNNGSYNSASDKNRIPEFSLFTADLSGLVDCTTCGGSVSNISALTTAETDYFRPYPFYAHIYQLEHSFYSNYNSLQLTWNKSRGWLQFGANYTFSKDLATAASWNNYIVDPANLRNDYNPVPYDRTHTVNAHYLIDIGKRYKGGSKILAQVANDWQISGISSLMSGFPLASVQGENFGFGYGQLLATQVAHSDQSTIEESICQTEYGITKDSNGYTYCTTSMNPVVWLGTPDVQLMPTVVGKLTGGKTKHQYINPLGFGVPLPGENGRLRLPYLRGPAYFDHDLSILKNVPLGEKKFLQLRAAGFNFLNHPMVSFNNADTSNLTLGFQNATAGAALTQDVLLHQNFGVANIKVGNRLMELSAKFEF
jgi:hypothetical protein